MEYAYVVKAGSKPSSKDEAKLCQGDSEKVRTLVRSFEASQLAYFSDKKNEPNRISYFSSVRSDVLNTVHKHGLDLYIPRNQGLSSTK